MSEAMQTRDQSKETYQPISRLEEKASTGNKSTNTGYKPYNTTQTKLDVPIEHWKSSWPAKEQ